MPVDATRLKQATSNWARLVLVTAVAGMPDQMRPYAPIGKAGTGENARVPGELRASIAVDPVSVILSASLFGARIVAPVIQARTTDQGSPPHQIRARKVHGLLVFDIGGETVFTSKPVNHPGNDPKPWWDRALAATWRPNLRYAALHTAFG